MSTMRITLRRKVAVAGTALFAAVALPLQAGAAHAATPDDDLVACNSAAVANYWTATNAGTDYDLSAAIDDCVTGFLQEMGVDPAMPDVSVTDGAVSDGSVTDGSINIGIPGSVDGVTDPLVSTDGISTDGTASA
jgi:hypothetical protein